MRRACIVPWWMLPSWLWIVAAAGIVSLPSGLQAEEPSPSAENPSEASTTYPSPAKAVGYDKAIEPYVSFLKSQKQTPVDYILELFKQYELVVLCERFHPEVTQYDMFYELASDPRFQQQGGHIFTEVGPAAIRPYVESFLIADQLGDEELNEKLRHIARNIGWDVVWEKTNFYDFLKRIHHLNRSLPRERRVHVYPSDFAFDWKRATKESQDDFIRTQLPNREKVMAENIIGKFNEIRQGRSRNRAVVVMNYSHAFPHFTVDGQVTRLTTGYLMEAYRGRVANVMINTVAMMPGSNNRKLFFTAVQGGKWDAAFAVLGNPNVGFDFKGSPFGEDGFDYTGWPVHHRYRDVFTGFVFVKPLNAHRMSIGLPAGLVDEPFIDEVLRRYRVLGKEGNTKEGIEEYLTVRVFGYDAYGQSDYRTRIQQWLKGTL